MACASAGLLQSPRIAARPGLGNGLAARDGPSTEAWIGSRRIAMHGHNNNGDPDMAPSRKQPSTAPFICATIGTASSLLIVVDGWAGYGGIYYGFKLMVSTRSEEVVMRRFRLDLDWKNSWSYKKKPLLFINIVLVALAVYLFPTRPKS
jgi:hypothetical protein